MANPQSAMALQAPYSPSGLSAPRGKVLLESPSQHSRPCGKLNLADVEDHLSTAAPSETSSPPLCYAGSPEGQQHLALQELEACGDWQARTLSPPWPQDTDGFAGTRAEQVRKQVEYYFSHENLSRDLYLCSRMDQLGWVDLEEIVQFPRMRRMGAAVNEVATALLESTAVEVSCDLRRARRCLVPPMPGSTAAWGGAVAWQEAVDPAMSAAMGCATWGAAWAPPACSAPTDACPLPWPAMWGSPPQRHPRAVVAVAPVQASPPPAVAALAPAVQPAAAPATATGRHQIPREQKAKRPAGCAIAAPAPVRRAGRRKHISQDTDGVVPAARPHTPKTPKTPASEGGEVTPSGPTEIHTWLRWGYDA
uniref:HTH La-type RNA-binding domain-containing protein n=1 Tax=Alexandrium andersonii TaxID=327968 RepID=A0A7S2HGL4_9DINO|mmetsp:Transcript_71247/g.159510  ORF Transcript_71247/g.159510 Transcript_71247/m.159510 type:complete len:365 (+) Transcript_71247:106-1200(+)